MMTSSNGNLLRITGPLFREFTGHQVNFSKWNHLNLWQNSPCILFFHVWRMTRIGSENELEKGWPTVIRILDNPVGLSYVGHLEKRYPQGFSAAGTVPVKHLPWMSMGLVDEVITIQGSWGKGQRSLDLTFTSLTSVTPVRDGSMGLMSSFWIKILFSKFGNWKKIYIYCKWSTCQTILEMYFNTNSIKSNKLQRLVNLRKHCGLHCSPGINVKLVSFWCVSWLNPDWNAVKTNVHLTHWGRVTHICVGKLTIIGSDNGLSPGRCQAIIWTSAGILLIGPLATNFSEISIGIQIFSFKKMRFNMSSAKWRPFCLGLNVLKHWSAWGCSVTLCCLTWWPIG